MEKAREHPPLAVDELPEAIAASLLLFRGQIPTLISGETPLELTLNGEPLSLTLLEVTPHRVRFALRGRTYESQFVDAVPGTETKQLRNAPQRIPQSAGALSAPISGVVSSVLLQEGAKVQPEDVLLRLEAMKMQNAIPAGKAGTIKKIHVQVGQEVSVGDPLAEIE